MFKYQIYTVIEASGEYTKYFTPRRSRKNLTRHKNALAAYGRRATAYKKRKVDRDLDDETSTKRNEYYTAESSDLWRV